MEVVPPTRNTTEEYDGSSWTAGGTLSVAFEDAAGAGTQTAGLKFGGRGTPTQVTEKYDGSSWTTSGNMNTGRGYLAGAGYSNISFRLWRIYASRTF